MVAAVAQKTVWKIRKAKHDAKSRKPEQRGADGKIHQVLHDDVACILSSCKAGLYHGKTCLHEEYKGCAQQDPDCVYS